MSDCLLTAQCSFFIYNTPPYNTDLDLTSYMSAHVLLNLLLSFRNKFNKFNNTRTQMLDSTYHMALRLL